jgi:outer membrane biosynthesis protein TonB
MVVNGTSYVGLGWRPRHLTASCRNFPYLEDSASKDGKQETETAVGKPEPESHPEPSGKPEPTSEPEPISKPELTSEPEPSSEPEPNSEPQPKVEPEPRPAEKSSHSKVVSSRETKNYNSTSDTDKDVTVETSVSFRVSSSQGKTTVSNVRFC